MEKEKLFQEIAENVVEMEDEVVEELCEKSLEMDIDPVETINGGLIPGMDKVGQLYEDGEYFLPEVLTASFALNTGIDVLKPHIKQED
ncbi:MAG: B12-binding domain-containing protein, partial [Clostridia bacterium]|nr:B12-binding domain-containing protein [Clostridia bacterium]